MKYKFSDEVLAAIARSLQLAMLGAGDIVDHLRSLEVEPDPTCVMPNLDDVASELVLTDASRARSEQVIADLMKRSTELKPVAAEDG